MMEYDPTEREKGRFDTEAPQHIPLWNLSFSRFNIVIYYENYHQYHDYELLTFSPWAARQVK